MIAGGVKNTPGSSRPTSISHVSATLLGNFYPTPNTKLARETGYRSDEYRAPYPAGFGWTFERSCQDTTQARDILVRSASAYLVIGSNDGFGRDPLQR
ncbi:predicted protein [Pyrenophora tritici-repentis Pt-1C-BFP]|uniref:Uncharacterized protein n=1 Tax=Pyrenophora tritici-repentis (strain Pt-1C-BFP) TaxID=426418 RepID=B2W4N3_PYRTR|nr:uncharacterized protein PTRG_04583 [Pyrenophora tritici-repentis Pt-1C-BFP]EDU47490.1 predicted protein [Pyrenophora tritici-repentis Pt-1C-BFP]